MLIALQSELENSRFEFADEYIIRDECRELVHYVGLTKLRAWHFEQSDQLSSN
jgi:hypothetical protein